MYHSFLIHSSADGHLGCFHVLAIINSAALAKLFLRLELFAGKFFLSFFLFFSSLSIPWFGLLSHISSLRLPSGHSGLVLTLSNAAAPLRSAPACWWWMRVSGGTSPLGVAVRHVICGFYLFIFSSWLCCPPRFENFP